MTSTPWWLRGARSRPCYIEVGGGARLYKHLDFLPGLRGLLERFVMRAPDQLLRIAPVSQPHLRADIDEALSAAGGDIRQALFLDTRSYKNTNLIGPAMSGSWGFFIKSFMSLADAVAERNRVGLLAPLCTNGISTVNVRTAEGRVVVYELVDRARAHPSASVMRHVALELGYSALSTARSSKFEWAVVDVTPAEAADTLTKLVGEKMMNCVMGTAKLEETIPWAICHGDLTRWNAVQHRHGVVLIDYERVGLRPLYFDLLHSIIQEASLKGHAIPAGVLRASFAHARGVDPSTIRRCITQGMLVEIADSISDYSQYPANRDRVARMIQAKATCLTSLVSV